MIVDPEERSVTVLVLQQDDYRETGCYREDQRVISPTFPDLTLTVNQIFASVEEVDR